MATLRFPYETVSTLRPIFRVLDANNRTVASSFNEREATRQAKTITDATGHVHSLYRQIADVLPTTKKKRTRR